MTRWKKGIAILLSLDLLTSGLDVSDASVSPSVSRTPGWATLFEHQALSSTVQWMRAPIGGAPMDVRREASSRRAPAVGNSSSETDVATALREALASGRSLIFSESPDAIDATALAEARAGNIPFLRVTLRDQSDLDRLLTRVWVDNGTFRSREGPLLDIITRGGILLIDYNGSDPKLVEGFNSLFDRPARFGKHIVSPHLKVVGTMRDANLYSYPGSFYSRFRHITTLDPDISDPLQTVREPPDDFTGMEVELFRSPEFRDILIGGFHLSEDGQPQFRAGPLLQALKEGRPLLIRGGEWEKSGLAHFIRQILLTGALECNGETIPVPADFTIFRADTDYASGITGKRLFAVGEPTGDEPWVVNRETQDALFSNTHVTTDGRLTQQSGLLEAPALRLRVTEALADWVWNRIMHAQGTVDIEVLPGVPIPSAYRSLRSETLKQTPAKAVPQTWDEAKNAKTLFVTSQDPGFAETKIQRDLVGRRVLVFHVTPETGLNSLVASVEIESEKDGRRVFSVAPKGVFQALREGHTVILEGMESNASLLQELETALIEHPYLLENGRRLNLNALPGQLILLSKPNPSTAPVAAHPVELSPTDTEIAHVLQREFPERFQPADFERIKALEKAFETIPAPRSPGLYPVKPNFGLNRLRLLHRFDNWLDAFENVFISNYAEDPEVAAFMRVMVRRTFELDETGRHPHTVHGRRLTRVMDKCVPSVPWEKHVWELADTLSLDDLRQIPVGDDFRRPNVRGIFDPIEKALINSSQGERQDFYRFRFPFHGDVSNAPTIDRETRVGEPTWQEQKERILKVLRLSRAVMLKGSPGTGKSFVTEDVARELGYASDEIFGPVTAGPDLKEADVIARRTLVDGKTGNQNEAVAKWATNPNGGILIIDEANLTPPAFWNFMKGIFAETPYVWLNGTLHFLDPDRHRCILTGNQETLQDRQFQQLAEEFMVTVHFSPFDAAFLHEKVNDYVASAKERRAALVDLIGELHRLFAEIGPEAGFSLRDVQELCARVNVMLPSGWTLEHVVSIAWQQYRGNFNPEERLALEFLIANKYGVVVRDREKTDREEIQKRDQAFFSEGSEEGGAVTLVDAAAQMVSDVDQFLLMREARIKAKTGLPGKGKRGMIFEGPSGRGKDLVVAKALQHRGFVDANRADPSTPRSRVYYHLNASMDYGEIVDVVRRAQKEGSIVVLSELNLLSSALVEGKLNDVLTGNAAEGFAFIATINSVTFSGRESFSTALVNRVLYIRVEEYRENELLQLANAAKVEKPMAEEDIRFLIKAHFWISDQITDPSYRPTPRDFLRAIGHYQRASTKSIEEALRKAYGPLYLAKLLKDAALPARRDLLHYTPVRRIDNIRTIERIASFIVGAQGRPVTINIHGGGRSKALAFWNEADRSITFSSDVFESGQWEEALLHEASHGHTTRHFAELTPADSLKELYNDVEDMRHLRAFTHRFPASRMNAVSDVERRFTAMVQNGDVDELVRWMTDSLNPLTLRHAFQHVVLCFGKDLTDYERVRAFANLASSLLPVNPFAAALPFSETAMEIAQAFARIDDEDEIQFQQYRALRRLETMRSSYTALPIEDERPEPDTKDEQLSTIRDAAAGLKGTELVPAKPRSLEAPDAAARSTRRPVDQQAKDRLKRKLQEAIREANRRARRELEQMAEDLAAAEGVTYDRLVEMREQLDNERHSSNLLNDLSQSHDAPLKERARQLREKVEEALRQYDRPDRQPKESLWHTLTRIGKETREILSGRGSSGNRLPIGRRHGMAVHSKGATEDLTVLKVSEERVERAAEPLNRRETIVRNPWLAAISEAYGKDLTQALSGFVQRKLQADKVAGMKGTLNVHRLLSGGDPSTAFDSTGGRVEESKKEVVVLSASADDVASPIVREICQFLISQGFRFTVYTSPTSYVEGIMTVGDLLRLLPLRRRIAGKDDSDGKTRDLLMKDLQSRKPKGSYEVVTLGALSGLTEAIYLYGAFKQAMDGRQATDISPETPPSNFERQVARALDFLKANGLPACHLKVDAARETLDLDGSYSNVSDLSPLSHLNSLRTLDLTLTDVEDLGPLRTLIGLESLNLSETQITDLSPIAHLPNLVSLDVSHTAVEDLSPLRELHLEDLRCSELSATDFSPVGNIKTLKSLTLDFNDPPMDTSFLSELDQLAHLSLVGVRVSDVSFLKKLPVVHDVDLTDTQVNLGAVLALLQSHSNKSNLTIVTASGVVLDGPTIRTSAFLSENDPWAFIRRFFADHNIEWSPARVSIDGIGGVHLDLSDAPISNIEGLNRCRFIVELNLRNTHVKDIAPLSEMHRLETLNIDKTLVTNIKPIQRLRGLQNLTLARTAHASDFSPLLELKSLETLVLSRADQSTSASPSGDHAFLHRIYDVFQSNPRPDALKVVFEGNEITSRSVPDFYLNTPRGPTLEEQRESAVFWLEADHTRVAIDEVAGLIHLNLSGKTSFDDDDLSELRAMRDLASLDVTFTPLRDLSLLQSFPRLEYAHVMIDDAGDIDRVYQVFRSHPNRERLTIRAVMAANPSREETISFETIPADVRASWSRSATKERSYSLGDTEGPCRIPATPQAPSPILRDEMRRLKEWAAHYLNMLPDRTVMEDSRDGGIHLYLTCDALSEEALARLNALGVTHVSTVVFKVKRPNPLHKTAFLKFLEDQTALRYVQFLETDFLSPVEIYTAHGNPEELRVMTAAGQEYGWKQWDGTFVITDQKLREPSFDEQLDHAWDLLRSLNLPANRLSWDPSNHLYALDLRGAGQLPILHRNVYTRLARVAIDQMIPDTSWLEGLRSLEWVATDGFTSWPGYQLSSADNRVIMFIAEDRYRIPAEVSWSRQDLLDYSAFYFPVRDRDNSAAAPAEPNRTDASALSLPVSTFEPGADRNFLTRLIRNLSEPESTIRQVQRRFTEEGLEQEFVAMLVQVEPEARKYLAPAQTPIVRAAWALLSRDLPESWRSSAALQAAFTAVMEATVWLIPLAAVLSSTSTILRGSSDTVSAALLMISASSMAVLARRYIFLPLHGFRPGWVKSLGIQETSLNPATRRLSWRVTTVYAISAVAFSISPWLAVSGILVGIFSHALHDVPRLATWQRGTTAKPRFTAPSRPTRESA